MLTGEDLPRGLLGMPQRQFPRVFDTLTRQGLIPPTIVVGIEVPRDPSQADERELIGKHDRRAAFVDFALIYQNSWLFTNFCFPPR